MTTVSIIGSSSAGNGYILETDDRILIIELGCKYSEFIKTLNYDVGLCKVEGCLVTHAHSDHLRKTTVAKMVKNNIPIFSTPETCKKFDGMTPLALNKKVKIGHFSVQPFPLFHNCECYGFVITCPDGVRICFATDTSKIPYKFKDIHCFMVESNNSLEYVIQNAIEGHDGHSAHLSHLSNELSVDFLRANFAPCVQQIILIHLSSTNGNASVFVQKVKEALGFNNIDYAERGKRFVLSTSEF